MSSDDSSDSLADGYTPAPLPHPGQHLPGIGGQLKGSADDFVVEELPLYEPCGSGEHVYLRMERRDRETRQIERELCRLFQLRDADIGTAGLKDRTARATQTFSLHAPKLDADEAARRVGDELGYTVLAANRHTNKLRTGHLAGNRFVIRVAGVHPDAAARANQRWEHLQTIGAVPNYYGEQRFGREGDNAVRGRQLLLGQLRPRPKPWLRRFLLSAYQSELFNRWLAARISAGHFGDLIRGDVMRKRSSGGLFTLAPGPEGNSIPPEEQERFARGETDYTGPIFGRKMTAPAPASPAAEAEHAIFSQAGLDAELLARAKLEGTRRSARLPVGDLQLRFEVEAGAETDAGLNLRFHFQLPPGSYATVVLACFQKETEKA